MWYRGPVATVSKKLPHVGLSAFHNEYMALRYATAHAVWMRQPLQETGWGFAITEPTPLMGDNIAANQLVAEDFITTRNQYIYLAYHYRHGTTLRKYMLWAGLSPITYLPNLTLLTCLLSQSLGK